MPFQMVVVKLPDSMSGSITFENILSIRVLEWLVILVGCRIKGTLELILLAIIATNFHSGGFTTTASCFKR